MTFALILCQMLDVAMAQTAFTHTHTYDSDSVGDLYYTHSIEAGDFYSASNDGTVTVMLGDPDWNDSTVTSGRVEVLAAQTLAVQTLSSPIVGQTGSDFIGFALVRNIDPVSSANEFIAAEYDSAGQMHHRNSGGTAKIGTWPSTPMGTYDYAGFWNSGPTSGNVRGDVSNQEVIIPSESYMRVYERADGDLLNEEDIYGHSYWTTNSLNPEYFYGHVVSADLDADTENEIIAFGTSEGKVVVMSPDHGSGTQGVTIDWVSDPYPDGGYGLFSGAAVADIDGDDVPEIVVVAASQTATVEVRAYEATAGWTTCKYRWRVTGSDYVFTSPVIGDVTGDSAPDIVVLSNDKVVSVLEVPATHSGSGTCDTVSTTYRWEHTIGGSASNAMWIPVLANINASNGSTLDILVASDNRVEVLEAKAASPVKLYFNDPDTVNDTTAFYPSAVVINSSIANEGAQIYIPGWSDGKVYRLTTCSNPTSGNCPGGITQPNPSGSWRTFMGDDNRTGAK